MNNDFNKIDDFLKQKVESSHFAVNEAHWEDALRRLNPEEDKKRPWLWILGLLLIVGVTTVGAGIYINGDTSSEGNKLATSNSSAAAQTAAIQDNAKGGDGSINNAIARNESLLNNSPDPINPISTNYNNAVSKAQSFDPIYASNTNTRKAQTAVASNRQKLLNNISAANTNDAKTSNAQTGGAKIKKRTRTKNQSNPIAQVQLKKNRDGAKSEKTIQSKKEPIALALANPNAKKMATDKRNDQLVNTTMVQKKAKPRIYKSVAEMQAMNPRYVAGLENYDYEVTDIKLNATASADVRARAAAAATATPKTDKPIKISSTQPVMRDFNSLYLIAGLSAAKGYRGNTTNKTVYGLSPNLGFGYQLAVRDNVNLYFSLYASYLNHLNIKESSKQTTYSFDKTTKEIEVARKNLIQIHMPVTVGFRIKERHSLLGGIGLIYGVNTLSTVNNKEQNVNEFGYMSGLRTMDANIHIGYEYKISDALRMNLMYQEGLIDMTKNEYFNNNQEDRNRRISIGVRFNFDKR